MDVGHVVVDAFLSLTSKHDHYDSILYTVYVTADGTRIGLRQGLLQWECQESLTGETFGTEFLEYFMSA